MTIATENAAPLKSSKSRNSNSSVQIKIESNFRFEFVPRGGVGRGLKNLKKNRPEPDGRDASRWHGRLHVQKFTLLVFNDVKSPGQSFHEWHFFDQLALSP